MSIEDREPEFERARGFGPPSDPDAFLAWLKRTGNSLEDFRTYPAWDKAPRALKRELKRRGLLG